MKKKLIVLLSFVLLGMLTFLGSSTKTTSIASYLNNFQKPGDPNFGEEEGKDDDGDGKTFDHIDIESAASFTYYVDGEKQTVNINFYEDQTNLSKINIYKKNQDGTLTEIPVTGKWQNQQGTEGESSTNKEYRISGTFDIYYDDEAKEKEEVIYVVKFTLSVTIGGVTQDLVYTEEYSYNSSNNVCPGKTSGNDQGIDVLISGTKLEEYFSSSLKIVKVVENAADATFTFNVKAKNSSINYDKDVQITTSNKTGFVTIGGLKAGEEYIVTEINIPDGYELVTEGPITITAEKNKTIEVTATNRATTIDINGIKTWNDNNNQDGKRPETITVNLLKNGTKIDSATVSADEDGNWTYVFNDLPEYEKGEKINYTITEEIVEGYTTQVSGYNITNTHIIEKTEISGTKTWVDNNNQDGKRPVSITVNLFANGTKVDSKVVTSSDNWTYSFTNLDKYANGEVIEYTIEEVAVESYTTEVNGYDITNTHTPEKTEVSGTKTWEDNNDQDGIRPSSVTINLIKDEKVIQTTTATKESNWEYSFINLDKYANGELIEYTIEEVTVKGYTTEVKGYDITNTHTPEKTEVSGTKTWEDNNDQDGIRPIEITVNLFANGSKVASKVVKSTDNWKYTFTNLDKYANGQEINYTITEDAVEGYTPEVNGYNLTNTHTPEKIEISGTKTWDDNNNQDGLRPESITVNLLKNGTKIDSKTVSADEEGNWTYTFEDLPKYEKGSKIEYKITEETVAGYATTYNGYNIINTHETETIKISGTKTWIDNANQDGKRPESITVNLFANGEKVTSKTISADEEGNWTYTFDNLDKYANGELIDYTITEDTVEGYTTEINGYNIKNTHTPETTEVLGKKIWNDNNDQDGLRPESITVNLFANGKKVESANITAGENGDWTYAFIYLPKYKNGEVIEYTVTENEVEEYTTTYDETNPYIIINTHQTKKVEVSGTKTWEDNDNQDGKRPESITVRLHTNGEEIDSKVVSADAEGNWKYTFDNLDMYKEGQLIGYTITEDAVENYSTTINGYNITNSHTPEKISINGIKTWDDNNNQDGKRPESITINLVKDNIVIATTTATEESNWEYSFENLDKYEKGQEIEYSLTEETVDGYVTNIDGYDITNTHEIEKITFQTTKIWDDNENQDGIRPTEINVKLYKNGELLNTVTITEEDNWTYIFENLDRYENGEEVIYTIEEDIVLGYNTEINYDDIDENNIITSTIVNTHTPEKIEIDINKTWNDYNNISNIRPENISVELYANGELVKTIIVTNQENWKYTITDLDKYANGREILYTIKEKEVAGYTTTYNGFNIINTHEYGKGGDVEELPPQTGIEVINTTTNNQNIIIYLIVTLLSMWIIGLKKFV